MIIKYITGLACAGKGIDNALETAKFFNQIHPFMIGSSSLTIFPDTEIGRAYKRGKFEEASELERVEETRVLLDHLTVNTFFSSAHVSTMAPTIGLLPEQKTE